ncbi:MAG: hypothetical protein NT154_18430 [Verrucomicrobia bacterium]|nr:hypothetical protein [Verrucomicrobiota bacterium]
MSRLTSSLLVVSALVAVPACKPAADGGNKVQPVQKAAQPSRAQAKSEDSLVQQAVSSCRQRIQEAATAHAANAKLLQEAKVLDMEQVTQQGQLEAKREVVRKFLASNEAFKSSLVGEEAAFTEELTKLNLSPARIASESKAFQSGIRGKEVTIRMRDADQRIGTALLGALDLLEELWGQWSYNKEYDKVQFNPPGALKKYNDFMETIDAASREQ